MVFSLGKENYGIPLLTVKEVIPLPELTPIPFSKSYVLGIMNLRGQVLTVLDLRTKFGIKSNEDAENVVIICEIPPLQLGVLVDSIETVITLSPNDITPKPESLVSANSRYVSGIMEKKDELILFLDIEKCFTQEN